MMNDPDDGFGLTVAGRPIDDAWTRVRRYCGLPWGDSPPETWAYRYYDTIETEPDEISPVDVLAAGALQAGLSRDDLAYFWDHRTQLADWLAFLPRDLSLATAGAETIGRLSELPGVVQGSTLSLVTKVLHLKRPALIPLIDRETLDWFRPVTGERRAATAWMPILQQLSEDLRANDDALTRMSAALKEELGRGLTHVRLVDIAIWMGGQQ